MEKNSLNLKYDSNWKLKVYKLYNLYNNVSWDVIQSLLLC